MTSIDPSQLADKIIGAHKGFFNKESEGMYRENSVEVCRISNTKDYIKIIELDVRKSRDGILYCYHGNMLEYYTVLKFPRNFSAMKRARGVDTLSDVLGVISEDKIIFLDLKDQSITRDDLLSAVGNKKFKEIILGNRSVSFLSRFHDMPSEFTKCMNGNIFSAFYDMKKLKEAGYTYVEVVLPFLVSEKLIRKIEENGLIFVGVPAVVYWNKKSYWKTVNAYNIKFISSDFI